MNDAHIKQLQAEYKAYAKTAPERAKQVAAELARYGAEPKKKD